MNERRFCEMTGKACFTKREASETIAYFKSNRLKWNHRGKNIPQRSYYCEKCGTYHLTHLKELKEWKRKNR